MMKSALVAMDNVDIDALTTEEILSLLDEALMQIFEKVATAGLLILGLERRGYDVRQLRRRPIVEAVRNVAIGLLARGAFAAYYDRPDILRKLTTLPIDDQERLVEKGSVEVVEPIGKETTHRLIEIGELRPEHIKLVFDKHRIRSVEEQAGFLNADRVKEKMLRAEISHDPRTGVINCRNATAKQVEAYIKKHGL